ncbi:MAG: hypothetical protein QM731_01365 [Chitinophagaceae bacterium]
MPGKAGVYTIDGLQLRIDGVQLKKQYIPLPYSVVADTGMFIWHGMQTNMKCIDYFVFVDGGVPGAVK